MLSQQFSYGLDRMFANIFVQGVELGHKNGYVEALTEFAKNVETSEKRVKVLQDTEKEFIEIDFDNMRIGTVYIVNYSNEWQAVQRLNENEIAFYDVDYG